MRRILIMRIHLTALLLAVALPLTAQQGVFTADIDHNADPCNDFFEYSNGAWRAANPIPASMDRWSRRWKAGEENKDQLKVILDADLALPPQPKGSSAQLIGDFYGACMNTAAIDKAGLKPIEPLLKSIDGVQDAASLNAVFVQLHSLNLDTPFGFNSSPDNHRPGQVIADVYAAGLGLPERDYYLKPDARFKEAREKYVVHVAKMLELAGAKPEAAKAQAATILAFETRLAEATFDNVTMRDPKASDNPMTAVDLEKSAPHIGFAKLFAASQLNDTVLSPHVTVDQPKFLAEVDHEIAAAPMADWRVYLRWQILNHMAGALPQAFVDEDFDFNQRYLSGVGEPKPRWKQCAESSDRLLGDPLGKEYVARYFPAEAKERVHEMVVNILASMGDVINGLDWMSPETKKRAQEKIAGFTIKVGYPDTWEDYSSVDIERAGYARDVLNASHFLAGIDDKRIGKLVDRKRWGMTPPTSNAYYNPQMNEIVFPAGILQSPAFSMNATDAVNYGAIGVVIGHEISHGFDDQGAQFNAIGALDNWWTPSDYTRFQEKTACVAHQFDGYFIEPGIHHNGKLVLGESIGDLAGVKIAYLAFKKTPQGQSDVKIDGFTPDQQFFIAWGQFRGDQTRPAAQRLMVQNDPHPVAKFRVLGPLSNFAPFAQTFSCKKGAAMVRPDETKCVVW